MKLYELTEQYKAVEEALGNEDLENEDVMAALSVIKGEIEDKVENIGKLYFNFKNEVDAIENEVQRLTKRQVALQNRATRLRDWLLYELQAVNIDKVKRELFTVSIRKSPPSVDVLFEDLIPNEYRRIIPESWQPDKKAIIDLFKKDGSIVAGTQIISDKKTVVIR